MADIGTGDTVTWNTPQGETHGTVVEVKHAEFTLDGRTFKADEDEPYVVVESDTSGKHAAHKVSSVTKKS